MRMKTKVILLLCIAFLYACKEDDLMRYDSNTSIYFDFKNSNKKVVGETTFSFAKGSVLVKDTIIGIPVAILGPVVPSNLDFKIIVVDTGTTANSSHFEVLKDQFIEAGKGKGELKVRVFRRDDLTDTILKIQFQLQPNENFHTDYYRSKEQIMDPDYMDRLNFTLYITDIYTAPEYWKTRYRLYLGDFSIKKFDLLCSMLLLTREELEKALTDSAKLMNYASMLKAYLQQCKDQGKTIMDGDKEMTAGMYAS